MNPQNLVLLLLGAAILAGCVQNGSSGFDEPGEEEPETERVVFVGNNWEGTADILRFDPQAQEFQQVARVDIIPDIDERMQEILTDPERLAFFLGIRMAVGKATTSTSTTCTAPQMAAT